MELFYPCVHQTLPNWSHLSNQRDYLKSTIPITDHQSVLLLKNNTL
jgi:hypothetical protein